MYVCMYPRIHTDIFHLSLAKALPHAITLLHQKGPTVKQNPLALTLRHRLPHDRAAAVGLIRNLHRVCSTDPKRPAAEQASHARRFARLGNWLGWLEAGRLFRPWMLDYPFPAVPAWLDRFPAPDARTRRPVASWAADGLARARLYPHGVRGPWRVPFDIRRNGMVESGDYEITRRKPRASRAVNQLSGPTHPPEPGQTLP